MTQEAKIPLEMLYQWERETPDKVFLRQARSLQWEEYTWAQVGASVRRVAAYLRAQDFPAGSRIAIWSANSVDWVIADLAIMMAGHISVPLYAGQDIASARYILEHSGSCLIFLGAFDQVGRLDEALPAQVSRVTMRGYSGETSGSISLTEVLSQHAPLTDSPLPDPASIFTFVYTSGTTGNPKGVMHAHITPGLVVPDMTTAFKQQAHTAQYFSFLPLSHIAERILVEMSALYLNATISFSEGPATFGDDLRSVQPTFFFAVPRLWIKFKEGVDAKIPPAAQRNLTEEQRAGLRKMLGLANANFIITGSAPCPRDVQQWFIDMGINLRDGYGMTENCIHGCVWMADGKPVPGCVGKGLSDRVKVRISDEGEVQFSSDALMKGYYREPEKTAEVLVDGWYHTGDTGRMDEHGNLWLTGRLSEVFKTTKGKFIKPIDLESRLAADGLLAQFCVFGHGQDQPLVLASLTETGKQLDRAELLARLTRSLDAINTDLTPHERIGQLFVTKDEWTIGSGLLTPTLKLKRRTVESHYQAWVQSQLGQGLVIFE